MEAPDGPTETGGVAPTASATRALTGSDGPDAELQPLDARALRLWRRTLLADTALAGALAVAAGLVLELGLATLPLTLAVLAAGLALTAFWPPQRYRSWRYQLRAEDLLLRRGVLWRTTSVVPHARIQHVDTRRGPFERSLGLARVVIFTAGTRGAALTVPALDAAEAEMLRDRLAELGGTGDAL